MTLLLHSRENTRRKCRRTGAWRRAIAALAVAVPASAVPICAFAPTAQAKHRHHHEGEVGSPGLANATVLIVRHAEKPAGEGDPGLAPAGVARAKAYAAYFRRFAVDGAPVHIDTLVASADSPQSARPRLTLEPLAAATGLPIRHDVPNKEVKDVARWLEASPHGNVLIAWHHGKLAKLVASLGGDPGELLPGGDWPDDVYDWVIALRYDGDGDLVESKRIVEPADLK